MTGADAVLTLPGLDVPLDEWALRRSRSQAGRIYHVARLTGGNVSHVFRLTGDRGTVVLKVRGTTLARIPQFRTTPGLVAVEARALKLFRARLPGKFPAVIAVSPERGQLLLEDFGAAPLSLAWARDGLTCRGVSDFGLLVGQLHRATTDLTGSLRTGGDTAARAHLVSYSLRHPEIPALAAVADRCLAEEPQLVHGDLAPKNVLIRDGDLTVCDLDGAHCGSVTLDAAYALAHVLLSGPPAARDRLWPATQFLTSYEAGAGRPFDADLLARCLLGVLLYRLLNRTVPYDLGLTESARCAAADRLASVAAQGRVTVPGVCRALTGETGR